MVRRRAMSSSPSRASVRVSVSRAPVVRVLMGPKRLPTVFPPISAQNYVNPAYGTKPSPRVENGGMRRDPVTDSVTFTTPEASDEVLGICRRTDPCERTEDHIPSYMPGMGVNELKILFPKVAAEAYNWDASQFSAKSNKKVPWICLKGHQWDAVISNRTRAKGVSCPYCSGKRAIVGETDLQTQYSDIAEQADGWDPREVTYKSHKN